MLDTVLNEDLPNVREDVYKAINGKEKNIFLENLIFFFD